MRRKNQEPAQTNTGRWGQNLTWTLEGEDTLVISGNGIMNESMWTDEQKSHIRKIIVSEGITIMERNALYNFRNAKEIVLPESLTMLGKAVFEDCRSLEVINFPSQLTTISGFAFFCCYGLKEVHIPPTVMAIEYGAFMKCTALETVEIPYSVTKIGDHAFKECDNLTISGYSGTYAEVYANACNIPFIELEGEVDRSLFPDISSDPSSTYLKALYWAVDRGIIRGLKDDIQPLAYCARGQFIIMFWRYLGRPEARGTVNFIDLPVTDPTYNAVMWAAYEGFAEGFDDGTFRTTDTVTRRQICKLLWNASGKPSSSLDTVFEDVHADDPDLETFRWCYEKGIIGDTGESPRIRPESTCQRQQTAKFLYEYARNVRGEDI